MDQTILDIRDLKTYFFTSRGAVKAVDGINLKINEDEILGLVGESGSGKTVTALSIMRLVPIPGKIVQGKILFKDRDLLELSETEIREIRGKKISMIFQDPSTYLNPVKRIGEQIAECFILHQNMDKREAISEAVKTIELVEIPSASIRQRDYPHQLSGGMKQRVLIAMALACKPNLIIADEPTTMVDVIVQAEILEKFKDLKKEFRCSILLITHDFGIVAEYCDKVAVIYAGNIVEYGNVQRILSDAWHPYTKGLIDSIPRIDKRRLTTIKGAVPDLINPPSGCKFHPRCPYCRDKCTQQNPKLVEVEEGEFVACLEYERLTNKT